MATIMTSALFALMPLPLPTLAQSPIPALQPAARHHHHSGRSTAAKAPSRPQLPAIALLASLFTVGVHTFRVRVESSRHPMYGSSSPGLVSFDHAIYHRWIQVKEFLEGEESDSPSQAERKAGHATVSLHHLTLELDCGEPTSVAWELPKAIIFHERCGWVLGSTSSGHQARSPGTTTAGIFTALLVEKLDLEARSICEN
ncbi:uncharacterized protein BO97DRAFT_415575 [Aspergillus homomorphus CBS 101889]|uniref:Uncharacterized protein n=1 Tax=Aspergillus homomorphus (strain CBS 101889) TaxID=1450537 RepID=A0A395HTE0_ASPHC|nr:hypothetical protein BO97DRAFT_415575 [Aspergillus homomorphus CBS 101889]RAL11087.1 hypothetical protein BO97DRAFT_415575 [Aspergillus homomorphus CBS 101889]